MRDALQRVLSALDEPEPAWWPRRHNGGRSPGRLIELLAREESAVELEQYLHALVAPSAARFLDAPTWAETHRAAVAAAASNEPMGLLSWLERPERRWADVRALLERALARARHRGPAPKREVEPALAQLRAEAFEDYRMRRADGQVLVNGKWAAPRELPEHCRPREREPGEEG